MGPAAQGDASPEKQALFGDPIVVRLGEAIADIVEERLGKELSEAAFVAEVEDFAKDADARLEPFLQLHPPPCSVRHYINRITRYSGLSEEALVCTAGIMNRVCGNELLRTRRFEARKDGATMSLAHYNAHRIVLAAALAAAKFNDEMHCSNAHWAKVGGVTTDELNDIERSFLRLVNHRLLVEKPYFKACEKAIWFLTNRVSPGGSPRSIACSPMMVESMEGPCLDGGSLMEGTVSTDDMSFEDDDGEGSVANLPTGLRARLTDIELAQLHTSMESIGVEAGAEHADPSPKMYGLDGREFGADGPAFNEDSGFCTRFVGVIFDAATTVCDKVLPPVQKLAFGMLDVASGGKPAHRANGCPHAAPVQTV